MHKSLVTGTLVAAAVGLAALTVMGQDAAPNAKKAKPRADAQPSEAAVERTRETIQMLDDIYKQTIVLVTDKYVHDTDDFPAGSAAVELFKRVSQTGFHNVRLIDASGEPYAEANVAKSDFEKEGVKQLKAGNATFERVTIKDGQPYLQMVTAVPVVMEKCIMCHPHYEEAEEGEPIGAISYELPIK